MYVFSYPWLQSAIVWPRPQGSSHRHVRIVCMSVVTLAPKHWRDYSSFPSLSVSDFGARGSGRQDGPCTCCILTGGMCIPPTTAFVFLPHHSPTHLLLFSLSTSFTHSLLLSLCRMISGYLCGQLHRVILTSFHDNER